MESKKNAFLGVFSINILNALLLALIFIHLANLLGPEEFGVFTFAFTISAFPAIFVGIGSENVLMMMGSKNQINIPILFGNALSIRIIISCFFFFLVVLFSKIFNFSISYVVYITIVASLINSFFSALYTVIYRLYGLHIKSISYTFLSTIIFFLFILITPAKFLNSNSVAIFYLISNIIVCFFFTFSIIKLISPKISFHLIKKNWFLGFQFSLSQAIDLLFQKVDIITLQFILGGFSVGIYSASNRITSALIMFPSAFQFVFLQQFHKLSYNRQLLNEYFKKTIFIIVEFSLLIIGLIFWNSELIIGLLYSDKYSNSSELLKFLSIAFFINFIGYPYSMHAEALGYIGNRLKIRILALFITLLLSFTLIPMYKEIGAAISIIVGNIIFNLFLHYSAFKNIFISAEYRFYIFKIVSLFIMSGLLSNYISDFLHFNDILLIILKSLLFIAIYFFLGFYLKIFKSYEFIRTIFF